MYINKGANPLNLALTGVSQLRRLGPGPGGQGHDHALIPAVPGCAIHHQVAVMGAFWQLPVRLPLPGFYSLDDPLFDTAS